MSILTRVLIVDDKEENLYYLRALLTGHGCQVDEARHGAEALVKARQRAPDLIVSDLLMPVMDGYTLLRYWKADPQLKKIPFIVYTATYTEAEDERLALSLGADAFILKPAEPEDFLARIREVQANVAAAVPTLPKHSVGDEKELLKVYSETLIRKLEEKMLLLEQANQALEQDLAERKQMEAALRRSEQEQRQLAQELEIERARLAEAQQVAKMGSWETDLATLTVNWSAETHQIFETDPARFTPSHQAFLQYVHPEDRQMVDEAFVNSLNRRETSMIDHRIVMPDGRVKYVEERWQVFHNGEGRAVRALGTCRDITEKRLAELEVRRSTELLRAVADSSPDAIFVKDLEGRYLLFNQGAARLVGRSVAEVLGKDDSAIFGPEDVAVIKASDSKVIESGRPQTLEEALTAAGTTRTYLVTKAPYRDAEGKTVGLVGISRDITERKLAAEKMRVNEERFQLLARATKDAIWDWDLLTNKLWWGQGFETLFGFHREEVEPTVDSWASRVHPEEREAIVADVQRMIASGEASWSGEYRFRRQDGSYAYVLDRGYILRDADGKAIRMIGGITDISERREAEERLRDQATLLDKAQDAILVRDLEHRILYWNKSAERLYGWTAEEALNRLASELFYKDTTAFQAATEATLQAGEWVGEIEQRTKRGEEIVVECHWTLVRDKQGQPKSILAINTDITQRKKLEQQFLRAQRMESIGTLAGGIAHDLNNVLAPIIMSIDLLKMDETNPVRLGMLEMIETSANRGAAMVSQVLSFARGLEGRRIEVQAKHLIRDIIKIANETFPKNIKLQSCVSSDLWSLKADPTQLHQVLLNLCVNARDAMPEGGQITISAENMTIDAHYAAMNIEARVGPYVKIEVEDTGTGMSKDIIEKIFDPFFTTKEVGKGTGLGLSTVQAIIKSHGGFIRVYSDPGMGARFRIYLPAHTAGSTSEVHITNLELPRGQGQTVLVVDDEVSIRQITKQTLEAFGYKVLVAADGSEAVSIYVQHQQEVALVLTDMMMPVMDGPATIQVLLRLNPKVLIIGASGISANGKVAQAAGLGVKHFLPKPYTAETLLKAVQAVLSQAGM